MQLFTKITEVNLSTFIYRLFHEDFFLESSEQTYSLCIKLSIEHSTSADSRTRLNYTVHFFQTLLTNDQTSQDCQLQKQSLHGDDLCAVCVDIDASKAVLSSVVQSGWKRCAYIPLNSETTQTDQMVELASLC